ncbi:MAG TPA: carboxypeptidase-like regulatory domain-containing protein, partial [Gemmatimonadales bacterium]|nr:carboxypeptidase-like regulatory domain-containing protein [Gemmatimonadales bacterium]
MRMKNALYVGVAAIAIAAIWIGSVTQLGAQQAPSGAVPIDNDDIGGVVTGVHGPEAGVWVIAETTDLPTKFAKMVVTDDQGRYVVPDLPKAQYRVWVRGYGLVDSPKIDALPGKQLNLR